MIVQETGDPRLQLSGVAWCTRRSVLEKSALKDCGQTIPLADQGRAETFQDAALHVQ